MQNIFILFYASAVVIGLIYLTLSIRTMPRSMKMKFVRPDSTGAVPGVSILKPLKGIDDGLENNLRSFFNLDYPDFELIFGFQSAGDPAIPLVRSLSRQHPKVASRIVISDYEIGMNPKVNNLFNMHQYSSGEFIFISDSNTRVEKDFLLQMTQPFHQKQIGLVTATIRGFGEKNIASALENLHLNAFVAPNVFLASRLSGLPLVVGKAIMIRRRVLNEIGGFRSLTDFLAEDYWMGLKVHQLGYRVKTLPVFVNNFNEKWTFEHFLNRHTRWAKIRRHINLFHYLIESFSNPVAVSFVLGMLMGNVLGLLQFLFVVVIKIFHDGYMLRIMKGKIKLYQLLLVPFKDLLFGILWFIPFFSREINWRNNRVKIARKSIILPIT